MNAMLNQFAANSCGVEVLAGPQEATAIGNVMLQAKAGGHVADVWDMRRIIADSVELRHFMPQDSAMWDAGYEKYCKVAAD